VNGFAERRLEGQLPKLDNGTRKRHVPRYDWTKDAHSLLSLILRATLSIGGPPKP